MIVIVRKILDAEILSQYGNDWVIQDVIEQHPYMAQFSTMAVNTIRVNIYRSYVDEQLYIVSAAMRIGKNGAIVDNGHAGGGLVQVDLETGNLGHEVIDHQGNRYGHFNGVDFENSAFSLPNWEEVKEFSREVASFNHHCRLIALDIAIKEDGKPILIEWNVAPYSFSYWIPMLIGATPFGEKTDEIIEYCKNQSL